jgi:hypothetical protein
MMVAEKWIVPTVEGVLQFIILKLSKVRRFEGSKVQKVEFPHVGLVKSDT